VGYVCSALLDLSIFCFLTHLLIQCIHQQWESSTKFEASFIGHTYVARLASDPTRVIDSYTLQTTKIPDCPDVKQQAVSSSEQQQEVVVEVSGDVRNVEGENQDAGVAAAAAAGLAGINPGATMHSTSTN
jgi:hypothetical protein